MRLADFVTGLYVVILAIGITTETVWSSLMGLSWIGWLFYQFVSEYETIREELYRRAMLDDVSDVLFA